MRNYFLTALVLILFVSTSNSQQLAFPTAEGYGKYTTGGRGGADNIIIRYIRVRWDSAMGVQDGYTM